MPRPRDTSPDAWARQFEAYRSIGPEARLRLALEMSEDVRRLALAGIRHRHPDWPEAKAQAALTELLLGRQLAAGARAARPG